MNINTNVYGLPETWESFDTNADYASVKVPHWGSDSNRKKWYNGFLQGNLILNEQIDLSLAHWGINGRSGLATKKFFLPYGTADSSTITELKSGTLDVYRDNGHTFPAIFQYRSALSGEQYMTNPSYQYAYNAQSAVSSGLYGVPILDFKYNKVIIVPTIVCGYENPQQTGGFTVRSCTIREYFDTYQQTYPFILQIRIDSSGIYYGQIDESHTYRYRTNYGAICQTDTRDKIGYPYMYNGTASENRINFLDVLPYALTICGIDNNNSPPFWQPQNFPQNTTLSLNDSFAMNTVAYNHCRFMCDNGKFKLKATHSNRTPYITAYWEDATEEEVLTEIAYVGFWFADNHTSAERSVSGQSCTDNGLYLPKFDSEGVTTGEYWQGAEAGQHAPADDKTPRELYDYDPNSGGGGETDDDSGDLGNFRQFNDTTRFNYPCTVYALTESNFKNFADALNALYLSDQDTTQMQLDFKGSNPTDYIINCFALPFQPNFLTGTEANVEIGPQTLINITGKIVNTATSFYIDCGTKTIPKRGNFMDFEPYTQIELYLPMCGSIKLDPALVVGKTIRVVMYYNILTNSATAAVYRQSALGDTLIGTATGEIGISIPFSAANMGQYQNAIKATENAIKQNNLRLTTGVATTAIGIAGALLAPETGGLSLALTGAALAGGSSALSSAMKNHELHYELEHTAPSLSQCSSADGSLSHVIAKTIPWLFIKRAKMLSTYNEEAYAKTIGHACCINDTLGYEGGDTETPRSGLVVCGSVDTSGISKLISLDTYISPTADEVNMIKQALASGIIL